MIEKRTGRLLLFALFFGWLCLILLITLFTHNYYTYGRSANWVPFSSIRLMLRSRSGILIGKNVLGNVLIFMPIGFLFPLLSQKKKGFLLTCLFGLGFSLFIEACQYTFAARIFDCDDVLLNTIGTAAGRLVLAGCRFFRVRIFIFH